MIEDPSLANLTAAEDWSDLDLLPRMRRVADELEVDLLEAYQLLEREGEVPEIPDQDLAGSAEEASERAEPQGAELRRLDRNVTPEPAGRRFDPSEYWWNRD